MTLLPARITLVVDPNFGDSLERVASRGATWIVDTPVNRVAFEKYWREHPAESHLSGVTSFTAAETCREDSAIGVLESIDLHHGSYSSRNPYQELEVIGAELTKELRAELELLDFRSFSISEKGFVASFSPTIDASRYNHD